MEIKHFAVVAQGLEAMREAFRDDQCSVVVGAEDFAVPAQEGRRVAAQVDGDVEHFAAQAADELGFGMRRPLEVHAAHRAPAGGEGVVDLGDMAAGQDFGEFLKAEQAFQIAATVTQRFALQHAQIGQRRRQNVETGAHAGAVS